MHCASLARRANSTLHCASGKVRSAHGWSASIPLSAGSWLDLGTRRSDALPAQVDVVVGQIAGTNASSQAHRHGRRGATPAERIDHQVAAVGVQPQAATDELLREWSRVARIARAREGPAPPRTGQREPVVVAE